MGRSVSHPSGAYVTFAETPTEPPYCCSCGENVEEGLCGCDLSDWQAYEALSDEYAGNAEALDDLEEVDDPRDWIEGEVDWRDLCQCWSDYARELWPSMWDADDWIGREDHVLATNSFAHFGVSEYCGLMAFWLVPREDTPPWQQGLAERWCKQAFPKLEKAFGTFRKAGTMSNGRGVFTPLTGGPVLAEEPGGHVRI